MKIKENHFYKSEINGVKILLTDSPQQKELEKTKEKSNKTLKRVIGYTILLLFIINMIVLPLTGNSSRKLGNVNTPNAYIINDGLLLSAHRAGGGLKPEETKSAFRLCLEATDYKVDVLEFDLHLTKDNMLVLLHDDKVDRTSNGKGDVSDYNLDELKKLNFGYYFQDPYTGEYPYKKDMTAQEINDAEIGIFTLDEVLSFVENDMHRSDMKYIIEIKDNGKRGKTATDKLVETMERFNILDRVVVGTFHGTISRYMDDNYGDKIVRSSGITEVLKIYYSFMYGVKLDVDKLGFRVLQIPMGLDGFYDMSTKAFIDYCHSYGLAVQYWTINDYDDVKKLKLNGADCIMTDDPYMAYAALKSK